jgi:pSer/pThr/pTyr-binding forkhead associated (FHA) protein
MDAHDAPRLVLEDERRAVAAIAPDNVENHKVCLTLGSHESNQFVATGAYASRFHARIERHHNDFYLVDESTNGTYVQTEDETVHRVHRDRLRF